VAKTSVVAKSLVGRPGLPASQPAGRLDPAAWPMYSSGTLDSRTDTEGYWCTSPVTGWFISCLGLAQSITVYFLLSLPI
jgi:hypothetical protein